MALYTATLLHTFQNRDAVNTMTWLLKEIDFPKLVRRLKYVYKYPEQTTKVVLMEYNYVSWNMENNQGYPDSSYFLPNTNIRVQTALNNVYFKELAKIVFCNSNSKIHLYTRMKIKDNQPIKTRRQLVLMFEPYALVPEPSSPTDISREEELDDDIMST